MIVMMAASSSAMAMVSKPYRAAPSTAGISPAPPKSHEPEAPAATWGAPDAKVDIVASSPTCFHHPFWLAMYHSSAHRCGCCETRIATCALAAAGDAATPTIRTKYDNAANNLFIVSSLYDYRLHLGRPSNNASSRAIRAWAIFAHWNFTRSSLAAPISYESCLPPSASSNRLSHRRCRSSPCRK